MIIDITKIPTFFINLDHKKDRRKNMEDLLRNNKFHDFERFRGKKAGKRVGCSMSHSALLKHIVKNNIYPSLVLEDDLALFGTFNPIVEFPDNADAMYLGFSKYGWNHNQDEPFPKSLKVTELNEKYHRVYNMLGRHAIIHLNSEYDQSCIDIMDKFIEDPDTYKAGDVSISKIHTEYNIYCLNQPIFYQDDHGTRGLTKKSLYDCDYVEMDKL